MTDRVRIRYTRPPDREQIFEQELVARLGAESDDAVVTLVRGGGVSAPKHVDGRVILEPDAPIVWFTFPGARHDVGRFHLADGRFTGWYANVLTPVEGVKTLAWSTTDLFLDVWTPAEAPHASRVLDEEELRQAVREGWVSDAVARQARADAERLVQRSARGSWPPPVARRWTLETALQRLGG